MSDDEAIFNELPEEPERAFLKLEAHFRTDCEQKLAKAHQEERTDVYQIQYISKVIAAISELGLAANFPSSLPNIDDVDYSWYLNFSKEVDHYITRLKIRQGRRQREYSVALDGQAKIKLRHLLNQIKETVDKLEIPERKKEALYARIAALEGEIDRDRTRFDVVADLWIEVCDKVGEGVEKLEPLRKWIDSMANVLAQAKQTEADISRHLPGPAERKKIEPPRRDNKNPVVESLDDDIPF